MRRKWLLFVTILACMVGCLGCKKEHTTEDTTNIPTKDEKSPETKEDTLNENTENDCTEEFKGIELADADIRIKKYPQDFTCFRLITSKGVVIVTDPYYMNEEVKADIVTESHTHTDHTDTSCVTGDYKLIKDDGEYSVKGIDIVGISGLHDKVDGDPNTLDTSTLYKNYIYVFDIDGIRIAQFGSQGNYPSDEMFEQIGKVDILIMQIFDGGTKMTQAEVKQVINKLEPKIIIPAHCGFTYAKKLAEAEKIPYVCPDTVEIGVSRQMLDDMKQTMIMMNN